LRVEKGPVSRVKPHERRSSATHSIWDCVRANLAFRKRIRVMRPGSRCPAVGIQPCMKLQFHMLLYHARALEGVAKSQLALHGSSFQSGSRFQVKRVACNAPKAIFPLEQPGVVSHQRVEPLGNLGESVRLVCAPTEGNACWFWWPCWVRSMANARFSM